MKTSRSRTTVLALLLLARAHLAHAEPDTFGVGSGVDGMGTVSATTILNDYAPITADTGLTGTTLTIGPLAVTGGPGLAAGNLILVWQTTGLPPTAAPSGSGAPLTLSGQVGAYELARIDHMLGSTVTLTHPLVNEYASTGAQVVRVPEYTSLGVATGAHILPYAWDGTVGGIIVIFANGDVLNSGVINASAAGFRGGIDEPAATSVTGCTALDGPAGTGGTRGGGAHKGEGLVSTAFSTATDAGTTVYGYGNVAIGGGGGDCLEASGGGGGNGGAGGIGGASLDDDAAVGGLGGVALSFDPTHYLSLGGGGGAGKYVNGSVTSAPGAAGGGVIFIRTVTLQSNSQRGVLALGGTPPGVDQSMSQSVASGGGGAGGTIVLELGGSAICPTDGVDASGGEGGPASPFMPASSGGGGGGGFIFEESGGAACSLDAYHGVPGNGAGGPGDGEPGVVAAMTTAFAPTTCSFLAGACGGCTTSAVPSLCPADHPVCVEGSHTCVECATDADCVDSLYGGVCGAGNICGVCNATENVCSGTNPVCDTSGARTTCVACNGDLGTTATSPCPGITSPYCMLDGSCGTCGAPGASQGCAAFGAGITHSGPVCGAGGACTTMCSVDSDCTAAYCDAMDMCEPLLPDGAACDRAAECVADQCTDGKCGSGSDLKDAGTDSGRDAGTKSDAGGRDSGSAAPPTPPRSDGGNGTHPAGSDSGAESADGSSSSGCSCRSARSEDVPGSAMLAGLTAVVVSVRRRRRV
jgi:MYXO-CTERM domain-containing protein